MSVRVFTASYAYSGADRFDITRVGADRARERDVPFDGAPFAPSSALLWPAKSHLQLIVALDARAVALGDTEAALVVRTMAGDLACLVNDAYARLYREEMATSYRRYHAAWAALCARDTVTLVCFCRHRAPCVEQRHVCHRHLLATYLVGCGAVDMGEHPLPTVSAKASRKTDAPQLVAISGTRPPTGMVSTAMRDEYAQLANAASECVMQLPRDTIVVHGGAAGIDSVAESTAKQAGLRTIIYRPWYDAFLRAAPRMRNTYVATAPRVDAFPSTYGRGTQHAIAIAKQAGCDVRIHTCNGVVQ